MSGRSLTVMETLLSLHHERDVQGVLSLLLRRLTPEMGPGAICCYIIEPNGTDFRLEFLDDGGGELPRLLWRHDLRAPITIGHAQVAVVLKELSESGAPVEVSQSFPIALEALWTHELAEPIRQLLDATLFVVAPIGRFHGPCGLLVMFVTDGWPPDVAAECAAHAATAISGLVERRNAALSAEGENESGLLVPETLERVAEREISRADRYRRVLSVAVLEQQVAEGEAIDLGPLTTAIRTVIRQSDSPGRIDERRIAVILPETPAEGIGGFIRRVREAIGPEGEPFNGSGATFPNDGRTWQDLLDVARARLVKAEAPVTPSASASGSLRAAFPSFRASGVDRMGKRPW